MMRLFLGIRWGNWGRKIRWPSRYTISLGRLLRINLRSSRCVLNFIDGASRNGVVGAGFFRMGGLENYLTASGDLEYAGISLDIE